MENAKEIMLKDFILSNKAWVKNGREVFSRATSRATEFPVGGDYECGRPAHDQFEAFK